MHCIVTAGPTHEPLDDVRRLTNFSTGKLGTGLANYLVGQGHEVILLRGRAATFCGGISAREVVEFGTVSDLADRLAAMQTRRIDAVFHAAAVSDFSFGKIWERSASGTLSEMRCGKLSTRRGPLLAELIPTPKVISKLRDWFPHARLVGWKYEVEGDRDSAVALAKDQIAENRTDACVANGPGYGEGFGIVSRTGDVRHISDASALFEMLADFAVRP